MDVVVVGRALPSDEVARISFLIPHDAAGGPSYDELRGYGTFAVSVNYSDLAGNVWASRLDVNQRQRGWEVSGVVVTSEGRIEDVGSL